MAAMMQDVLLQRRRWNTRKQKSLRNSAGTGLAANNVFAEAFHKVSGSSDAANQAD